MAVEEQQATVWQCSTGKHSGNRKTEKERQSSSHKIHETPHWHTKTCRLPQTNIPWAVTEGCTFPLKYCANCKCESDGQCIESSWNFSVKFYKRKSFRDVTSTTQDVHCRTTFNFQTQQDSRAPGHLMVSCLSINKRTNHHDNLALAKWLSKHMDKQTSYSPWHTSHPQQKFIISYLSNVGVCYVLQDALRICSQKVINMDKSLTLLLLICNRYRFLY